MQVSLANNIGFAAAACTTLSFIPQLTKLRKQGGRDLSYAMLSLYLLGLALWLAYGILLRAAGVIVANAACIVLVVAAIVVKAVLTGPPEPPLDIAGPRDTPDSETRHRRPIEVRPRPNKTTKTVKLVVL